jgi:hypothetical protein
MPDQPPIERSPDKNPLIPFITAGVAYVVKYIAYGFLTPAILLTFAAIVFDYIAIAGPELPFLRYFSSLMPATSGEAIHFNTDDLMLGYGSLTTGLFLLSILGNGLLRLIRSLKERTAPQDAKTGTEGDEATPDRTPLLQPVKRRLIISSIVITAIFAVSLISIPFAPLGEGENPLAWYVIFIVIYIIALISYAIYAVIDSVSDRISIL